MLNFLPNHPGRSFVPRRFYQHKLMLYLAWREVLNHLHTLGVRPSLPEYQLARKRLDDLKPRIPAHLLWQAIDKAERPNVPTSAWRMSFKSVAGEPFIPAKENHR